MQAFKGERLVTAARIENLTNWFNNQLTVQPTDKQPTDKQPTDQPTNWPTKWQPEQLTGNLPVKQKW